LLTLDHICSTNDFVSQASATNVNETALEIQKETYKRDLLTLYHICSTNDLYLTDKYYEYQRNL